MRRIPILLVALACGLFAAVALSRPATSTADAPTAAPIFAARNLTFDFVAVGASSGARPVTVTNAGTAALKFGRVEVVGRDAKDFTIASDTCTGASLAPKATCAVGVVFTPSVAGTRIGNVRFTDNSPCRDWVTIAGSGTDTSEQVRANASTCESSVSEALQNAGTTVTNTTTNTTTNVTTTTTAAAAPVSGNSSIVLPKSTTCASRRSVTVGLAAPKGKTFASVKVLLGGRVIKTLKGQAIKAKVSLKGLPRGRFTLQVKATTTDGKRYVRTHHYVTCVAAKP